VLEHRRLGRIVIHEDGDTVSLDRFANEQGQKAVGKGAPEKTPPLPLDDGRVARPGVVGTAKKP
jgi:hypothetical protein